MNLTKEDREQKRKDSENRYYDLTNDLESMKRALKYLKNRRQSDAFKMLNIAIDLMLDQVRYDYDRYVKRIRRADSGDDVRFIQKALNREKLKNAELEKKIEEAKTSSGLFIDFVREKLNFKSLSN